MTAGPTALLVQVVNLCKRFGELEVLRKINLDVHPSEKLVIIGSSRPRQEHHAAQRQLY